VWNWLDTESELRIVALRKDSQLQEGLIFGTSETLYMMAILQVYEVDGLNCESILWYLPTPSSGATVECSSPVLQAQEESWRQWHA